MARRTYLVLGLVAVAWRVRPRYGPCSGVSPGVVSKPGTGRQTSVADSGCRGLGRWRVVIGRGWMGRRRVAGHSHLAMVVAKAWAGWHAGSLLLGRRDGRRPVVGRHLGVLGG